MYMHAYIYIYTYYMCIHGNQNGEAIRMVFKLRLRILAATLENLDYMVVYISGIHHEPSFKFLKFVGVLIVQHTWDIPK